MSVKQILFVHGIGDQAPDFAEDWKKEILKSFRGLDRKVAFKSLYWEDLRREAAKRYPVISRNFATVLESFGLRGLKSLLDNDNYRLIHSYVMDVLVYVGLPDMTLYFQNGCYEKLRALTRGAERETLIISHSLGSAMIPHVLWRIRQNTGAIPYHSLILLASPLGFCSPIDWAAADFLEVMGRISRTDRAATLKSFALAWTRIGDNRLHFLSNSNDVVCSDARFELPGGVIKDIIPVRQGFDDEEVALLLAAHAGSHRQVTFGGADVGALGANHDPLAYFRQPEFQTILEGLLHA